MFPILFFLALIAHIGPMTADAPVREPQMAASGSTVALAFGAGHTVYFSSSHDSGKTFSAPVEVAQTGILLLSHHRGPRIAFAANAIVITAVATSTAAGGPPAKPDLMVWRSLDGGKTWNPGKPINDVPGSAEEGLHALASNGKGLLYAAWLDDRGGKGKKLYSSRSTDGGATWSRNVAAYLSPGGSICECCHPSLAIGPAGELLVMWRNSLNGSRDMYLSTSRDGVTFDAPRKLGEGTWKLNACPMDGGGLAASPSKTVTAWRRDTNVFLDEPGQPERQIGSGKDVALALSGNRTYVAWVDGLKVQLWVDGKTEQLAATGAFPSLMTLPAGGVLAAWEENGGIQLARLP